MAGYDAGQSALHTVISCRSGLTTPIAFARSARGGSQSEDLIQLAIRQRPRVRPQRQNTPNARETAHIPHCVLSLTPSSLAMAFSTVRTQLAQLIPSIFSSI